MSKLAELFKGKGSKMDMPTLFFPSMKSTKDLIGIDLSDDVVKVIHASQDKSSFKIANIAQKKIPQDADEEIVKFVLQSIQDFEVNNFKIICSIPSKNFISRNIDMPSNNREEIAKIISLQVGRFTPYSRDEIIIDYFCREVPGQHYTNVLLIIVHRKIVDRYYRILEKAGLSIDKIAIASEGMAYQCSSRQLAMATDSALATIHITDDASDFTIVDNDEIVFVRNIPVGYKNFKTEREAALHHFVDELNKSMTAYQDEGVGKAVSDMSIMGMTKDIDYLQNYVQTNLMQLSSVKTNVKFVEYAKEFELSEAADRLIKENEEVSFYEILASLASFSKIKLDFVPKEVKLKRRVKEGSRDIVTLGILVMTLFVLISSFLAVKIYFKGVQIEKLDEIDESTFDQSRSLERISTKSRAVRSLLENRGRGLYVFDKVTSLIGEDIFLTQFSYDQEGNLKIVGTAQSMSRVFAFVTQLEESNYFSEVKTNETKSRRQGKQEVADFDISCVLAEGF